ncbi:MAG: hypothetical protein R6V35_04745 [Candidatus Nanohaloarchaea archaeon]
MDTIGRKIGLILIMLSVFTLTVSAANWSFEQSNGTVQNISNESNSVYTAKLYTDDGDELTPDRLTFYPDEFNEDNYINATTLDSEGNESSKRLQYHEGLDVWYALYDIAPQEINFTAQGVSGGEYQDSNGVETSQFNVTVGDYVLDMESGFSDAVRPGSNERAEVNVSVDGGFDENADITAYFNNHTNKTSEQDLTEVDTGEEVHYGDISVPDNPDSDYVLRVIAENPDTGEIGSYSRFVEVLPRLQFDINEFTSLNCDSSGIASNCEPETDLSAEVEITEDEADSVNVSTWLRNSTSSELERVENNSLSSENNIFTGSMEMPDINKSSYEPYAIFRFNASNQYYSVTEDVQIGLESYGLGFEGNNNAFINSDYQLAFEAEKAYSGDNYNLTRFNEINGTVSRSGSFELDFTDEDFSYDESSDLIVADFTVPEDASTGIHDVEFNFTDIYNETKSVSDNFRVNEFDQNFEVMEGLEVEVGKLHEVNRSLEIQNNGGASLEVNVNLSEEFDGVVNMTDSFDLDPDETRMINYTVNLTEPEDVEGEINLTESSGYSVEEDFEIDAPDCEVRNGSLCADHGEIDFGTVEGNTTEDLEVFNLYEPEMDLNISAEGNISDHLDFTNSTDFNDSETIPIVFEPNSRGNFIGTLNLITATETVSVNLTAVSNITEAGDSDLSISPSETTVSVPEEETGTAEFTVENPGEIEITDLNAELENGEANIDSFDLSSGGTNEIEVEVNQSDTLTITGQSADGEVTAEASITVNEMDNYEERASEIEDRVRELRTDNEDPSLDGDLTDLTLQAENVRTQWNNGNYEQAQETFEETQSTLDELATEIESQQTDTGGTPDQNQTDPNPDEEESGGLPILPIIAIVAILLIVGGFIFFESYIPEEGDPLYGVFN